MAKQRGRPRSAAPAERQAEAYRHPSAESPLRPEVGTQAQFRKKKPPATYRYDSSLSPALDWDGQNPAREQGEALIREVLEAKSLDQAKAAASRLRALSKPFLNWAGKAERLSFDVPTLPLFVHERLSTKAIIETLKTHRKDKGAVQHTLHELFGDPQRPVADQVLRAYEYKDKWVNRMILGDSLVVMNSLLHYEGLGGQVQMIYMDPPYGVKFGSNFQPFVRRRDVKHGDDSDMTREPEMVKAYRDTWEIGLHSYITYMRDRLKVARDLLAPTGSIFVQISDENVHHVREVLDEVFGSDNFCRIISFSKTAGLGTGLIPVTRDYILWYARDISRVKFRQLYSDKIGEDEDVGMYKDVDKAGRRFRIDNLTSQNNNVKSCLYAYTFEGREYRPSPTVQWKTTADGMERLRSAGRLIAAGNGLYYKRYLDDFPVRPLTDSWEDTGSGGFTETKIYVVQTNVKVVQRCLLMTTDPGDLVLDPTCGSGTTAYSAELWGRRWITIDTSRVPLALARQRLLTATLQWYDLVDEKNGPAAGFVYKAVDESANPKQMGPGIVQHVTLRSIATGEPPEHEVLVDRPEINGSIMRVAGPFVVEATIPTPIDWEGDGHKDSGISETQTTYGSFVDRMIEVLRKSPVLHLSQGKTVTFKNIRPPARTLSLSAEATVANGADRAAALVFGPENGAVSEKLVFESAKEARAKGYAHLYVIGFAIQPNARKLIEDSEAAMGVPATWVQATPDLMMGDLLKNMRSSQIFSVCGLPEIKIRKVKAGKNGKPQYQVELLGLDVFDPVEMKHHASKADEVPAWFLDTDHNGLCFHVSQAFFPRTSAWEGLKKALKATHDESVWDHLAGTVSTPFEAGEHGQVAVKVVDDRGNELLVVKSLSEATA